MRCARHVDGMESLSIQEKLNQELSEIYTEKIASRSLCPMLATARQTPAGLQCYRPGFNTHPLLSRYK
ncbi:unnamed protein product [Larinioides sclopetarius]|uniref:Uncharacterized protein n=1 Tax=Larinioides sclopetarius TaxID=280406 RepID=A0AAV1ZAD9_9ARAC